MYHQSQGSTSNIPPPPEPPASMKRDKKTEETAHNNNTKNNSSSKKKSKSHQKKNASKRQSRPKGDDENAMMDMDRQHQQHQHQNDYHMDEEHDTSDVENKKYKDQYRQKQHNFSIFEAYMITCGNCITLGCCFILIAMVILLMIFMPSMQTWVFALFLTLVLPLGCSFLVIYYSCVVGGRTHSSRTKKCLSINFWLSFMTCSMIIGILVGMAISYPMITLYINKQSN